MYNKGIVPGGLGPPALGTAGNLDLYSYGLCCWSVSHCVQHPVPLDTVLKG